MTEMDKHALLAEFAKHESEIAFATIVSEHLNLVYSTALRATGNPHHAEEITQSVFVLLARKAGTLPADVIVSGWLYQTARLTAANFVKRERRRQQREQEAYMQSTLNEPDAAAWEQIAPLLDDAMGELGETDRTAVVLRFFENKSAAEVATALQTTEAAAHKRVSRAVEKLRKLFSRQGVTLTTTFIASAVSANSIHAAPIGLAAKITATGLVSGAALSAATLATTTKAIAMTAIQKTAIATTIAVLAGVGIYEARQASRLRDQVQKLQQQQAPMTEQIQQLESERDEAARQLAALREDNERLNRNTAELLRLRGEASRLKSDSQELAKLKAGVPSDPTESTAKMWLKRMDMLKQQLKQTPEADIPELRFLTERDWLDVAKNFDLANEKEYRQAFSQLRSVAERKVATTLQTAMKEFSDANNGVVTGDLSLLKKYLALPLEDSILQRYVVYPEAMQSMRLGGDWIITLNAPIDSEFDMRLVIGPHGIGNVAFSKTELVEVLAPAIKAYVAANGGKMPNDPAQIASYITTPEQQAALQKAAELIKSERK